MFIGDLEVSRVDVVRDHRGVDRQATLVWRVNEPGASLTSIGLTDRES